MHNSCMVHAACTLNRRQLYWQQWRLLRNNWHSRLYRSQRHHMSSPVADRDAGGIARKQMGWTQRGNTEVSFWTINRSTPQQHCTAPRGIPEWHNGKNLRYTQKMERCTMTIMLAYKSNSSAKDFDRFFHRSRSSRRHWLKLDMRVNKADTSSKTEPNMLNWMIYIEINFPLVYVSVC